MYQFTRYVGLGLVLLLGQAGAMADEANGAMSLKQVMQGLGEDMNHLNTAIFNEDYPAIVQLAGRIADHPKPSAAERRQILGTLGADAGRFRGHDHQVHEDGAAMAVAAQAHDMTGVLRYQGRIMQGCVACHAEFRSRLVSPSNK